MERGEARERERGREEEWITCNVDHANRQCFRAGSFQPLCRKPSLNTFPSSSPLPRPCRSLPPSPARLLVAASVLFSPALLLVDHIHFQYNGMLMAMLLLTIHYLSVSARTAMHCTSLTAYHSSSIHPPQPWSFSALKLPFPWYAKLTFQRDSVHWRRPPSCAWICCLTPGLPPSRLPSSHPP